MDWGSVLQSFQQFFGTIIAFLPTIVAVLILLLVAWILAKVLRAGVRRLLRASGIDKRMGKGGDPADESQYPIAHGAGTAVFWIVWILFLLAILQVLGVEGIFDSIVVVFQKMFAAIPHIVGALVILGIFYLVGRLVVKLVTKFLTSIHFDELPVKVGLAKTPTEGHGSPSNVVGYIIMVFIMLFALMMAADLLGFAIVNELIAVLTQFLGLVLLGVIIIGVGIFVAGFVANILRAGGRSESMIAFFRIAIIVLSVILGIRAMGFADDLILLGFGLILGAAAIATAIAFGLGGRKVAGELLARWTKTDDKSGK
ncbi:MAG: mechanosensitive ion channel [Dehalococcoidia bacterium]